MAMLTWNDSFSVQVEELDNQHKRLINLINQLHDAMIEGKGRNILASILDELVDYTQTHFTAEEVMMKKCDFPGLAEHKKAHEELTQQVKDFQERYNKGQVSVSVELLNFLHDWLVNHVLSMDKRYAPYLAKS